MKARSAFAVIIVLSLLLAGVLVWRQRPRERPELEAPRASASTQDATAAASASVPAVPEPPPTASAAARALPTPIPPYVAVHPDSEHACGPSMVLVEGIYCPFVAHRCAEWIGDDETRCRRYHPTLICEGRPSRLRFCIDRFEYPNLPGVRPVVMVDYFQAAQACEVEGKRLCEAEEWSFACEGLGTWPYPYGLVRNDEACNIDRELPEPDLRSFSRPWEVSVEVERLDRREPSGSRPGCVSPFGVYDLTGNVDEWVHNRRGDTAKPPYESGLKGGYWGPIRARCRPMTTSHNGWFRFYQVGFRCCADPRDGEPVQETLPRKVRLPRRQRMPPATAPPPPAARHGGD